MLERGPDDPVFVWFRRLLLGIVVEILRDEGVGVDVGAIRLSFTDRSRFRFLWVDNHLRFAGEVRARTDAPLDDERLASVRRRFDHVWPELLGALGALPLADRLDPVQQEVRVTVDRGELLVVFDLEAD
ncbi:MAG: hypothetical protein H6738_20845 [Alphaproteobacteria bacterium]|nr:hypothetical protein [Alphaproteobacteria bacterium]MCB9699241.1 hypothetical protein [Alphaproteobacteria bacterium]